MQKSLFSSNASASETPAPTVTEEAARLLGLPPSDGPGPVLCSADELSALSAETSQRTIIAVYGPAPGQAYACRSAAYDRADACLTLFKQTATRLEMLHPNVFLANSGDHALALTGTFTTAASAPKSANTVSGSDAALPSPKMTILFVTHDFKVGGLEQVVIDIASLAKAGGHEPIIAYAGIIDEITRKDVEAAGIEHIRLPETFEERKDFLRDRKVSIVNAHYATIMGQESHDLGIPFLQTIHNMYLWLNDAGIAQWRELDKLTAGYIAVSANAAMVADLRLGLPPEKMIIVPNGSAMVKQADPDAVAECDDELRAELGIPPEGIVFVQVASFYPAKALWVTVDAFAAALKTRQDIYLVLLGKHVDPVYSQRLYEKIGQYGIGSHVLLPGYRKDVHRFLNLARAKLAPSFLEGWSLAINEAVQLGVPVIGTDVGGACEQLRSKKHIVLPAFLDNVDSISSEEFFAALTDERLHRTVAPNLAKAILEAAARPARPLTGNGEAGGGILSAESAYSRHLEIMQRLVQNLPIK